MDIKRKINLSIINITKIKLKKNYIKGKGQKIILLEKITQHL